MARDTAAGLMEMRADETFSGIYSNAFSGTEWLQVETYAKLVSGTGFKTKEILSGGMNLFIQVPLHTLRSTPGLGKAILGCLLNTIYMADPGEIEGRVFGFVDEARRFGAMSQLAEASDTGRKHKVTLQLLYQSEAHLDEVWGESGARTWRENCSWIGYSPVQDRVLAKNLSELIGTYGARAYSEGNNAGTQGGRAGLFGARSRGQNVNVHEIKRQLILPQEIRKMRDDELIVLTKACRYPIRCSKAIYFRRPELANIIKPSRYAKQAEA
jgi:type IV secretion system protein VirD4